MKKYFLLLASLPTLLFPQVYDDFTDGNLSDNPAWTGTTEAFKVNSSFQLQLNDSIESTSYLTTIGTFSGESEWRIWIRFSFSPSSNNYSRIYLASDQADLTLPLNGYFLRLGESGSSDAIELFRQQGQQLTSVCRGTEGTVSSSFVLRIKVIRNENGLWKILVDPNGGEAFQLQAEGFDDQVTASGYFGLFCEYTKSNASKMYFDDIYAGPLIVDLQPPVILSLIADSDSTLLLFFDEPLDINSAENPANYFVSDGIDQPAMVKSGLDLSTMSLQFTGKFKNGRKYTLNTSGIMDLAGNLMNPGEYEFSYYHAQPFDVVINELMADPSPPVGLPNYEYIELFNRTDLTINLDQWGLMIGSSEKVIQGYSIQPHGFLILAKDDAETHLELFGSFYGFSSFSLTNAGQEIVLKDKNKVVISSVSYNDDLYRDQEKKEGGWSLELINPEEVCAMALNWKASENAEGGTPGSENSVFSDKTSPPSVDFMEVTDEHTLLIHFSHLMDLSSLSLLSHYTVDNDIGNPSLANILANKPNRVELFFNKPFLEGIIYRLTIKYSIQNCIGIQLDTDTTLLFGLAANAESKDILINEILFNPWLNGVDYVEVYNNSQKVIDLSSLSLGTVKVSPPNPDDTVFYSITQRQMMILPSSYLVLTGDPVMVKKQYFTSNPDAFVMVAPFPAYNNDYGSCLLVHPSGEIIDAFDYSEEMHYPLLNYIKGVSLERTGFGGESNDGANWHSAAENAGFGTPGYKNSQLVSNELAEVGIEINPEIFSPDNDGYKDITSINYRFDQAGYMMTINIFGANGNLVRKLINNEYMGVEGSVNWDGLQDDNTKAPVGIYVFLIQIWDLNGNVKKYKNTAVLAAKL